MGSQLATQVTPRLLAPAGAHQAPSRWQLLQRDKPWWLLPATVVAVLGAFTGYAIWTAFFSGEVNQADTAHQGLEHCWRRFTLA